MTYSLCECRLYSPLGAEDAVEQCLLLAGSLCRPQHAHVLQDVIGQLSFSLTQELGFSEGGPSSLQSPLSTYVTLHTQLD